MSKAIKKKTHKYPKAWACIQFINCPVDGEKHDWSGKTEREYHIEDGSIKSEGATCAKCGKSYSSYILMVGE